LFQGALLVRFRKMTTSSTLAEIDKFFTAKGPFLPLAETQAVVGLKYDQLCSLEKQGRFPARVRTSANRVQYISAEIKQYLLERIAERAQITPQPPRHWQRRRKQQVIGGAPITRAQLK